MSGSIRQSLDAFEAVLRERKASVVTLMADGAARSYTTHVLRRVGFDPSEEILTWYEWHDGTSAALSTPSTLIEVAPGAEFHGTAQMAQEYRAARSMAEQLSARAEVTLTADDLWPRSWFPILRLFGQGLVAVDVGENHCPVHVVWLDAAGTVGGSPAWPSMKAFVDTLTERFVEGVYTIGPGGSVEGETLDRPTS